VTPETPRRLDTISTRWSLIRTAHVGDRDAQTARAALVLRYAKAVRAYVGGLVQNRQDADELAQDVVVRLLQGDFAGADPTRGRFRDLLKTAARNMVKNFWEKQSRRQPVAADLGSVAGAEPAGDPWLAAWQKTVLDHCWAALADEERQKPNSRALTVLKLRTEFADDTSDQLAEKLSAKVGTPVRPDAFRQMLRRARVRFAELIVEEVRLGLEDQSQSRIDEELAALELLDLVRKIVPADESEGGGAG
jgi:DNA-directed RNA polymerase specialized sigma24 family protein